MRIVPARGNIVIFEEKDGMTCNKGIIVDIGNDLDHEPDYLRIMLEDKSIIDYPCDFYKPIDPRIFKTDINDA